MAGKGGGFSLKGDMKADKLQGAGKARPKAGKAKSSLSKIGKG